jgi:demethylsterigmatocystin 6-O-methyltransferase
VPTTAEQTAFQVAHSTPLTAFQYAATKPKLMADFAQWMSAQRQGEESWLKVMAHEDLLGNSSQSQDHEKAFFVDVGGGMGHQCRGLKAWLPAESKERIILQDLPPVVSRAGEIDGVEVMPHNFWNEQPVKGNHALLRANPVLRELTGVLGAKFYYLRNVFHDYADEGCRSILRHIKDAASPDSTIIIDELVLPGKLDGVSAVAEVNASLDILLMASLAGQERTEAQWHALLQAEGLAIRELRQYDHRGHSVLIVRM